jgi:hypothetical protein
MYACTGDGGGEGGAMGALYITTLNRTRLSYGLGELMKGQSVCVCCSVCVCVCV